MSTRDAFPFAGFSERLFANRVAGGTTDVRADGDDELAIFSTAGAGTGSTSTTRTTALPSSTRRTLSASHERAPACAGPFGPAPDPENASQNADPSLPSSVCDAMDASTAC